MSKCRGWQYWWRQKYKTLKALESRTMPAMKGYTQPRNMNRLAKSIGASEGCPKSIRFDPMNIITKILFIF